MNFRTTYILLGVVVVALLGLGVYVMTGGDKKTNPTAEGFVLKSLKAAGTDPDKVTELDVERPGGEHLTFARDKQTWKLTAPTGARIDPSSVDEIVRSLLNAKTEKAADIAGNLAAHGLDNPPVKVTLRAGNISETVSLGNVTIGGERAVVYVTTSDQPDRVQAARRNDFAPLFKADAPGGASNAGGLVKTLADFRPLKLIGAGLLDPANQLQSMAVRAAKDEIALFKPAGTSWRFRLPADYGDANAEAPDPREAGKDTPAVQSVPQLLNTIISIQPAGKQKVIEAGGDFAKYGLDPAKNAPLQIDFVRADGSNETMYVSGPIKAEGQPDKYYARNEADSSVAEVPADPVEKVLAVLANKNLLRDRTVLRVPAFLVDAIDVVANGETMELRKFGANWQVYDADGKARPAKSDEVMALLNRLSTRQLATGFPPPGEPDNKVGLAPAVAEIRLWTGGIPKDAKPDAKPKLADVPTARVLFGHKAQGDVVYCRRQVADLKADFFVPTDVFTVATRGRLDYVQGSLAPLELGGVLKVTCVYGKEGFEVERPAADAGKVVAQSAWKINAPERLKGRPADGQKISALLTGLSLMRATKVVADKLTPDVLNRLEVNPQAPRMKVTLAIKDQPERTFLFGGDSGPSKADVFLKPGDQDLVFAVDRGLFDQFAGAQLQDMTVHRLDKTKLKEAKITGWQNVLGTAGTLDVERKDGRWTFKASDKFAFDPATLNPAAVDAFLDTLTNLHADSFVVYKEGAKPEHNLDPAKGAFAIELVQDNNEVVKVAVSPPNKDGKVFATSSLSPGDVFTMPDVLAAYRTGPAVFKSEQPKKEEPKK